MPPVRILGWTLRHASGGLVRGLRDDSAAAIEVTADGLVLTEWAPVRVVQMAFAMWEGARIERSRQGASGKPPGRRAAPSGGDAGGAL